MVYKYVKGGSLAKVQGDRKALPLKALCKAKHLARCAGRKYRFRK